MKNTLTLQFSDPQERKAAAEFIASLIETGVTWTSRQEGHVLIITFTGGY